ncbi:Gfo/Idh/MocA family oxidoreductase [Candidatus Sumerlaeota bacterium]|nr:Gfo/Idh/MocA family oxidoreductase [Candidatus Sumerlaeota bacterium]
MTKPVRIGLSGLGNMGRMYAQLLLNGEINGAVLGGVCSVIDAELKRYPGIPQFTDYKMMHRSGEVDAVIVATPHFFHAPMGIDAFQQGLHALIDKPLAVHKKDCERIIAAHKKTKGQAFSAMFNQRIDERFEKLKALIDEGQLGKIHRICWVITDWFRPEIYYQSAEWRGTWKGEGGGVLVNQCPHQLDQWQWLFGMPDRVRAFCHYGKHHDIEVEDEVTAYMEYDDGCTGVFITSTGEHPGVNRLEINAEHGRVQVCNNGLKFWRTETAVSEFSQTTREIFGLPEVWEIEIPTRGYEPQHKKMLQNYVDAILKGAPLLSPGPEGMRSVELANAIFLSSEQGKTVSLPINGAAVERILKKKAAESTHQKKIVKIKPPDITDSFNR